MDDVLDVASAAELCKCKPDTLVKLTRKGVIPGVKLGSEWIYPRPSLIKALCALAELPKAAPAPGVSATLVVKQSRRRAAPYVPAQPEPDAWR